MRTLITILVFIYSTVIFSQSAPPLVINEFMNGDEFTEILIVQDGYSLVDHFIGDNAQGFQWQGAGKFLDVPLFRNIKAGTIIIVKSAGTSVDTDIKDGIIEIGLDDANLFSFVDDQGLDTPTRPLGAMDFNSFHDFVWIRQDTYYPNSQPDHVYAIGYLDGDFTVYNTLPQPKLASRISPSFANSMQVMPGRRITDYYAIPDANLANFTAHSNTVPTEGFPNYLSDYDGEEGRLHNQNQLFWRELRSPYSSNIPGHIWKNNPGAINAVASTNGINLNWTATGYPEIIDYYGYMLIRYNADDESGIQEPVDGVTYSPGDMLGTAQVIANIPDWRSTSYVDPQDNIECGISYVYKLYLYRFNPDDRDEDGEFIPRNFSSYNYDTPKNARGRMYGSVHVETGDMNEIPHATSNIISKITPAEPELAEANNTLSACEGESFTIIPDYDISSRDSLYRWYLGNEEISSIEIFGGENSIPSLEITLDQAGTYLYALEIVNEFGCSSQSEYIEINVYEKPNALISRELGGGNSETYLTDTTINICGNENVTLLSQTSNAEDYSWYKDDNSTPSQIGGISYTVDLAGEGTYYLLADNGNACFDTSASVTINFVNPQYSLSRDQIVYTNNGDEETFILTNEGDDPLIINEGDIEFQTISGDIADFQLVFPQANEFPITIDPGFTQEFGVRFFRADFGESEANIIINNDCGSREEINLTGSFEQTEETIVFSVNSIDFRIVPNCDHPSRFINFDLIVAGPDAVEILEPTAQYINIINNNIFPLSLNTQESQEIQVEFLPTDEGPFNEIVTFDYITNGETKTVSIEVEGEVTIPNVDPIPSAFDLSGVVTCIDYIDTTITLRNTSKMRVEVDRTNINPRIEFLNGMPININAEDEVEIPVRFFIDDSSPINNETFTAQPCGNIGAEFSVSFPTDPLRVNIQGNLSELDFGVINTCLQNGDLNQSFIIEVQGNGATIADWYFEDGTAFTAEDNTGVNLTDAGLEWNVTFQDMGDGEFEDVINIIVAPCMDTLKLDLIGERITPLNPVFNLTALNFGTHNINDAIPLELTVTNLNADYDYQLIDVIGLGVPFSIISHDLANDLPINIPAESSVDFVIQYQQNIISNDNQTIELIFDSPCPFEQEISLSGETVDLSPKSVSLRIEPNQLTVELGQRVEVPIYVEVADNTNLNTVNLASAEFTLVYNPSVIVPYEINKGPVFEGITTTTRLFEDEMGRSKIDMSFSPASDFQSGIWAIVTFESLLGNSLITGVDFENPIFFADIAIEIGEAESGTIEVTGECDIENRLTEVGSFNELEIVNNINGKINLRMNLMSTDPLKLGLYNSVGQEIRIIDEGSLDAGEYFYNLDTSNLGSGIYLLVLHQGLYTISEKIIVIQ